MSGYQDIDGKVDNLDKSLTETKSVLVAGFIVLLITVVTLIFAAGAWWTSYIAEKKATYQDWIDTMHDTQNELQTLKNQSESSEPKQGLESSTAPLVLQKPGSSKSYLINK